MENSICLDTDILIDLLRNKKEVVNWIKSVENDSNLATTMINAFELYAGAYKSSRVNENLIAVKNLLKRLKIIGFTLYSIEAAGKQRAFLEKTGNSMEIRDLFIGIISLSEGYSLKTNNKNHFLRIDGLSLV